MDIAKVIRKRRSDLNITQEGLAKLTDMPQSRIGQIEREINNVTWDEVAIIGKALSIPTVKAWQTIDNELTGE